ncbi:Glutamate-rich protein [Trichinella spiralis]|uniref:Glutamate-rich protein n=1 Tax=Trichinella spiralis TaxID=6334 RepID=A0ABR3KP27_TRISP
MIIRWLAFAKSQKRTTPLHFTVILQNSQRRLVRWSKRMKAFSIYKISQNMIHLPSTSWRIICWNQWKVIWKILIRLYQAFLEAQYVDNL